jgi:hypothetical protein
MSCCKRHSGALNRLTFSCCHHPSYIDHVLRHGKTFLAKVVLFSPPHIGSLEMKETSIRRRYMHLCLIEYTVFSFVTARFSKHCIMHLKLQSWCQLHCPIFWCQPSEIMLSVRLNILITQHTLYFLQPYPKFGSGQFGCHYMSTLGIQGLPLAPRYVATPSCHG